MHGSHKTLSFRRCLKFEIRATDGPIGHVEDLYFDDEKWVVRYLSVATGDWLNRRTVLISPYAVRAVNRMAQAISVGLTRAQVRDSPDLNPAKLSRDQESRFHHYYAYPEYWPYATYWPWGAIPLVAPDDDARARIASERLARQDASRRSSSSRLRSMWDVMGYQVLGKGGPVGQVDDLRFHERTWAVSDVIINMRHWLRSRVLRIAPEWIQQARWDDRTFRIDMRREEVPSYPSSEQVPALVPLVSRRTH